MLAAEGAIPFIIGRNEESNKKVVNEIVKAGGNAFQFVAELSKPEQCEAAVKKVLEQCETIDSLVNNAGINDGVGLEAGSYENLWKAYIKTWCIII